MRQGGDDLADDFVPDELVALSGDDDDGGLSDASLNGSPLDNGSSADAFPSPNDRAAAERKRKRKEKSKERKAKKRKLFQAMNPDTQHSIAEQPPHDLANYLSSIQKMTYPDLSALELNDIQIPESCIADTTQWSGDRSLNEFVPFIIKVLPTLHTRLSQKSKSNGAPTLLFVTGAALRVADVTRVLKDKRLRGDKGGEVAKLFAKHFKLSEHVAYLKRTKVGAAVGTPGRIGKLLCDTDALSISALSHIILDVTFKDAKKRNLLDIPETRDEVFKTVLGGPAVLSAIKAGKIQLVLF